MDNDTRRSNHSPHLLPHQLQLVSDLVPISQPTPNGITDRETFSFGHNFIVRCSQGGDLAAVDILGVALEGGDLVGEVRSLLLLTKQPDL